MSTDPEAKLFYGYLQPEIERGLYNAIRQAGDTDTETPWSRTHTRKAHGCIGGIYGYDLNLGFFLAVQESLHIAEWDEVKPLTTQDFEVKPEWNTQLQQAAETFGLNVAGIQPRWYLVCLYF